jgi:multisubunit Na+/H+ antiporter MnhF subunit
MPLPLIEKVLKLETVNLNLSALVPVEILLIEQADYDDIILILKIINNISNFHIFYSILV